MTHQSARQELTGKAAGEYLDRQVQRAIGHCFSAAILLFKNVALDETTFAGSFNEALSDIMAVAIRLSIVIKEKIISVDYKPYCPSERSGELFDSSQMAVTDPDDAPPESTPVMCTVRLGFVVHRKDVDATERDSPVRKLNFRKAEVFTAHCLEGFVYGQVVAPALAPGGWL